jgi:glucose-1-phosphate thymidylyltransferase
MIPPAKVPDPYNGRLKSLKVTKAPLDIVGLLPAAGRGTRLAPLPVSKEIFPVSLQTLPNTAGQRPKAVCQYLLESMAAAGISQAYVVIRRGKWDIPAYLQEGKLIGVNLAYVVIEASPNTPFTLDAASAFVAGRIVALGFPDLIFEAPEAYSRLAECHGDTRADVVLGLFPADAPASCDMVDADSGGRVRSIAIKPQTTLLTRTWGVALWTPAFTAFMHAFVQRGLAGNPGTRGKAREIYVGDVIQAAIDDGMPVQAVEVSSAPYLDVGTPEGLARALGTPRRDRQGSLD